MAHEEIMKDKDYDLISTLYHALQGIETAEVYARDAEQEGDEEATAFSKRFRKSIGNFLIGRRFFSPRGSHKKEARPRRFFTPRRESFK